MSRPATDKATTSRTARAALKTKLATTALMGTMAMAIGSTGASAQSFLDGQSAGMRRCVTNILTGTRTIKKVKVHGHHFHCKPLARNTTERGNFRQMKLTHAQFGKDDEYYADFRVDNNNVIRPNALRLRIRKGLSFKSLKTAFKWYVVVSNPGLAYYVALYLTITGGFEGPPSFTYDGIARLARAVPRIETDKWETAAFQIAMITIAEHGRSRTRRPTRTKTTTQLNR